MFDARLRHVIDPPLNRAATRLARAGISGDALTLISFLFGLAVMGAIWAQLFTLALIFWLLNRLLDGLDGPVARARGDSSDRGGFIDIMADQFIYSGIPFAFALSDPSANALAAAFVIFSFVGSGAAFLTFGIMAAKRDLSTEAQGKKSLFYASGLAEGFETVVALALMCLLPGYFPHLAYAFGAYCWLSTSLRVVNAWRALS